MDWCLWKNFLNSGHNNFKHLKYVGLKYFTSDLQHHMGYFSCMLVENFNIPFKLEKYHSKTQDKLTSKGEANQEKY